MFTVQKRSLEYFSFVFKMRILYSIVGRDTKMV